MRAVVLLCILFLYLYNLGLNQVWQPNEAFYSDASKNMLKTGDFLTPVYNGEIRLNKPPMTYWVTALSFYLLGQNEFALRFFQALAGLGTGLVTYLLAKRLTDERTAFLSFLILTLSFQFVANSRYTSPEVLVCFFFTLSLYLWYLSYERKSKLLFFLALNASVLGVLTKGPAMFLLPAGIIFLYLLLADPKELLKLRYYVGTLYVVIASGWWFLYQFLNNREVFTEVFLKENIRRVYALQSDPIYFYALDINVSFLPYSFVFYLALVWSFYRKRRDLLLPLLWFWAIFLLFSAVKMKIPVYIMPSFPAMAIITAAFLRSGEWRRVLVPASILLTAFMMVGVVSVASLFKLNLIILIVCLLLPTYFLLGRSFHLAPAAAGFSFLLYLSSVLLPEVERYRPYRDIGETVRSIDPKGEIPTYEVGEFHHNLPFYADRLIIRRERLEGIGGRALVIAAEDSIECQPVKRWRVYRGSESRFFKFLSDIKRGSNFYVLKLCIFPQGR